MKEKAKVWLKEHEKEIIIAGITITGVLAIYAGMKYKNDIMRMIKHLYLTSSNNNIDASSLDDLFSDCSNNVLNFEDYIKNTKAPHQVSAHFMRLPEGKNVSEEMMEYVKNNNINLPANCTYRRAYKTGVA